MHDNIRAGIADIRFPFLILGCVCIKNSNEFFVYLFWWAPHLKYYDGLTQLKYFDQNWCLLKITNQQTKKIIIQK